MVKIREKIRIDRIELVTAGPAAAETGLLGWLRFRVNRALMLDGVTLRRTQDGRHSLSFPAKTDGAGRQRFFVKPLDSEIRQGIEAQVFAALGLAPETKVGS